MSTCFFNICSKKLIFQILYLEVLINFDRLFVIKLIQEHKFFCILIVKIVVLPLAFSSTLPLTLSAQAGDKTQYFVHLSFISILQLINGISSDLQKLLGYFSSIAIAACFRIPLAALATRAAVFPNNLALYLEGLKL